MAGCRKKPFSWQTRSVKKSPFRNIARAKAAERDFLAGRSVGFTARSSLKSMGRIPRSTGCFEMGSKYLTRRKRRQ